MWLWLYVCVCGCGCGCGYGCVLFVCACVCVCVAGVLSSIFTSSLAGAMPWQRSRASQILSALTWAQVGMLSDYPHMAVMRALYKAVRRVC